MSTSRTPELGRRTYLKALGVGALSVGAFAAPAAAHRGALQRELASVRAATSKYADVRKAIADGYVLGSPFVPGMGYHYVNENYVIENDDDEVDITKPAALVYGRNEGNGKETLVLGAAEYLFDEAPNYGGPFPDPFHGDSDDGMWGFAAGHWGLHAWVHVNNPAGTFAPFNSRPQFNEK
ncbi:MULTISPECIES: hypothetical protein [unclassified Haloferax]|uniref:hypothetical protein n=1 Tax=unclassified Haloferax TaxID=2625095 RepID=UPI002876CAC0|nr:MULTISPECIES: hypothetical protein [unclassified Haloferax]MDS0240792.1 hypothetical protein [Haloferax sp. S2CR25]MDS0443913.1 hypothetical protein [Haloferax sp. S2CR25-2]